MEVKVAGFELAESKLLRNGIGFVPVRLQNSAAFTKALNEFMPDLVLMDIRLAG